MFAPKTVIEGLRGVGRVELEFEEGQSVYVLLGRNAVGKTKTLEALFQAAFYSHVAETRIAEEKWQVVPASFERLTSEAGEICLPATGTPLVREVVGESLRNVALPCVFAGAQRRGFVESTGKGVKLGTADQRRDAYLKGVLEGMRKDFTSLGMSGGIEPWFVARAFSANRYQKQSDSREVEIETVLGLMHRIDRRVDPDFLEVSGDEKVGIRVDGEIRQLDQLSSGFASLLKIVQTIVAGYASLTNERELRTVEGRVFVDEIESHLHPTWQSRIVRLLVELFPNTTFFLTTHSSLVTSQCRRGEAYLLEQDDKVSDCKEDKKVRSRLIESPGTGAFVDLLDDVFGVDVNALKIERTRAADQRAAKAELLEMLRSGKGQERER